MWINIWEEFYELVIRDISVEVAGEREEVYVALRYDASFQRLVEEWKDCEELRPKPKEKWSFADKRRERE